MYSLQRYVVGHHHLNLHVSKRYGWKVGDDRWRHRGCWAWKSVGVRVQFWLVNKIKALRGEETVLYARVFGIWQLSVTWGPLTLMRLWSVEESTREKLQRRDLATLNQWECDSLPATPAILLSTCHLSGPTMLSMSLPPGPDFITKYCFCNLSLCVCVCIKRLRFTNEVLRMLNNIKRWNIKDVWRVTIKIKSSLKLN
jgi:hypothetical protein